MRTIELGITFKIPDYWQDESYNDCLSDIQDQINGFADDWGIEYNGGASKGEVKNEKD